MVFTLVALGIYNLIIQFSVFHCSGVEISKKMLFSTAESVYKNRDKAKRLQKCNI